MTSSYDDSTPSSRVTQSITEVTGKEEQPLQLTSLEQAYIEFIVNGVQRDNPRQARNRELVISRLCVTRGDTGSYQSTGHLHECCVAGPPCSMFSASAHISNVNSFVAREIKLVE
jgi:hypothetical protein